MNYSKQCAYCFRPFNTREEIIHRLPSRIDELIGMISPQYLHLKCFEEEQALAHTTQEQP